VSWTGKKRTITIVSDVVVGRKHPEDGHDDNSVRHHRSRRSRHRLRQAAPLPPPPLPNRQSVTVPRYHAAVLIRHITGLARPSVCPSVLFGLLSRKWKGVEKPNLVWTFPRTGVAGVLIFSWRGHRSGGRPHSMSAVDRYMLLAHHLGRYCWSGAGTTII